RYADQEGYRAAVAAWRFYMRPPLAEELFDWKDGSKVPPPLYPYADFSKAWSTAMKNLTLHEMVIAAIALKRYELSHGKPPSSLAALVPAFLPVLPCDLMDGQALRYRLTSDGSFT